MKKKYSLILFLFAVSLTSQAQFNVYHPFPDSNAYWKESAASSAVPGSWCSSYGYKLLGDTIVNGVIHHKLYGISGYYSNSTICWGTLSHTIAFYGALREDAMKHVYLCCTTALKSKDSLLYDFNLKVGDTLKQYNSNIIKSRVSSIDSIWVDGFFRKQFIIAAGNQVFDSIIEGIGSLQGVVDPMAPLFEENSWLNCFQQNGNIVLYVSAGAFNDSCTIYGPLGINELNKLAISFNLCPNPTNTSVTLSFRLQNKNAVLSLYTTMGQLVKSQNISANDKSITEDVSDLPNGVYYYTLSVDGVLQATKKAGNHSIVMVQVTNRFTKRINVYGY